MLEVPLTRHLVWRVLLVLAVLGTAVFLVASRPIRLGLDLEGGTQIVLQAQDTPSQQVTDDTLVRTVEVMRRRVDELGVAEPSLQRSGSDRIIIELPGVTDPEEALEVIGRTAQLTFHQVIDVAGTDGEGRNRQQREGELVLPDEEGTRLRLEEAALTGDAVGNARAETDPQSLAWSVSIQWRESGAATWADITGEAAGEPAGNPQRRVAIVLDEEIISSPEVGTEVECDVGITGADTIITGDFTDQEAKDLALLIRAR